ncbi:hypothetical protein OSCI_1010032 [Kamptonema sp. PCC 6506]|nr:hypothetical protein OSCI_1010032 [Kamptonema sp. PCC 6506]
MLRSCQRYRTYYGIPETWFMRESVDKGEVFSSKNPVYEVGCVSPDIFAAIAKDRRFSPLHNIIDVGEERENVN